MIIVRTVRFFTINIMYDWFVVNKNSLFPMTSLHSNRTGPIQYLLISLKYSTVLKSLAALPPYSFIFVNTNKSNLNTYKICSGQSREIHYKNKKDFLRTNYKI